MARRTEKSVGFTRLLPYLFFLLVSGFLLVLLWGPFTDIDEGPLTILLVGLFPLAFFIIGLAGFVSHFTRARGMSEDPMLAAYEGSRQWLPYIKTKPGQHLRVRLPVTRSNFFNCLAMWAAALFWNTLVILVGLPNWSLFVLIFALIGLFLLYGAVQWTLVVLTSGKTIVELSQEPVEAGQHVRAHVIQTGRKKIQDFHIKLTCTEQATYRVGTDTHTSAHVVYEETLHQQSDFRISEPLHVDIAFRIPPDAMHSFKGMHNAIVWDITVKLDAAMAPAFELSFPLRVVLAGTLEVGAI